ncbi:unnamed protein product [Medioppia subpectinata]|uniref:glutathione transferase n=1 Tax=Medioppia subpectinata TaxID=1979941 RepID=A0A7R9PWI0_9ACAR|nr:unnamed protein product [Medioppia subpectinata]CAG2102924.1 unnamed protein product [Medioppia subpectinata]
MSTESTPILGYWDTRGRAQPIRYLLVYAGVEFTDKIYTKAEKSIWESEKNTLGLDFPNLPYYIDGDLKLTQSMAILRYVGQKYGLVATDDSQRAIQYMCEQQILDFLNDLVQIPQAVDYQEKKQEYVTNRVVPQLDLLAKFFADKQWLTGGQLSYVDFFAYDILFMLRANIAETIGKYPTFGQYLARFEALPAIKAYQILAYWDIRARAQPIRLLLAYIGVDFEDRRYKFIDRDDYLADKFSLGLDFPNLPYYIDGDLKLTQSLAIIRYLAAKHGLMAGTDDPPRLAMQSMVEQYLDDIKQGFVPILLSDDYAAKRSEYSAGPLTTQLDQLVKFMGDEPWLTGDQLSYVDFMGYELLDWIRLFTPETNFFVILRAPDLEGI